MQKFCCLEKPSTWKRKLYLWNIYRLVKKLLRKKLNSCYYFNLKTEEDAMTRDSLLVVTIAFNNIQVLKFQIELMKKNLTDPNYIYVIADNSPLPERQKAIQELCREHQLGYILLPKNSYLDKRSASYSHGAAVTWLYYNYICLVKPRFFGFLDHDLYPVVPVCMADKLKNQPIYGFREFREKVWYVWMGLLFFDFEWVKDKKVNFLPCKINGLYLDTGGSNWYSIYSQIGVDEMSFPGRERKPVYLNGVKHRDPVDYIDDCWLHTNNGSNWKNIADKDDLVECLIKDYARLSDENICL